MNTQVYFCLGSNICPQENIRFAMQVIRQRFTDVITSNLYSSKAVGFVGDDFLNIVVGVQTKMSLKEVLSFADRLERDAGRIRVRRGRFDSRTLDIDVLLYGDLVGEHEGRVWPNQDVDENAYVLLPMSEVAGDVEHPARGQKFSDLWKKFQSTDESLRRVDFVY